MIASTDKTRRARRWTSRPLPVVAGALLTQAVALSACVADVEEGSEELSAYSAELETADFNFGPHALDQCDDPVASIYNVAAGGTQSTIFERTADGTCPSFFGYCIGDCVRVFVDDGNGHLSTGINVIVGSDLPDPGNCSDIAVETNFPAGPWDFSHAGACGKGASGMGRWHNCFVHDVCVWARCTDDALVAGGIGPDGAGTDAFCGDAFDDSYADWLAAHAPISCQSDSMCPSGTHCAFGVCTVNGLPEGSPCVTDTDCEGYCQLLQCWDGSSGDSCKHNDECQDGLTCFGVVPGAKCQPKKPEGGSCGSDADCQGYCQFLRCWDGSKGDKCGSTADCQEGLSCKKRCKICAQKTCQ